MPPKFFITHSWKDIDFARRLCDDLRAKGLEGFFDAYSIQPGDDIASRVARGLEECDVYVPLLSPAAVESKWCGLEINAAINLSLEPERNGCPRIIPVVIEPCKLPTLLRGRLHIYFHQRYDDALKQMLTEFGVSVQSPASLHPTHAAASPAPPRPAQPIAPSPRVTALSRDELVHLYNEARALQSEGNLGDAAARFEKIVDSASDYRDVRMRLQKLQLYLAADDAMKQALADKDDRTELWQEAHARLKELLQLDPQFLDAQAKLATTNRWIALAETYERLLDALDVDDWGKAFPLFEQIRSVKPNYKRTQTLFERAWLPMVQAGVAKKIGSDGREMLLVPAGKFVMGEGDGAHEVYLGSFYIDRYPVTNADYEKFVDATKHSPPSHWQNGKILQVTENHPVVNVSWDDANAYAQWAGKRLPTEAEWEKAASWDDIKKEKRVYPWVGDFDASKCNVSESWQRGTTPVGKYSPQGDSFYGIADMAGSVWEWCADWYDEDYYKNSPKENPKGPGSGKYRVLRGGSWNYDRDNARCAYRVRNYPGFRDGYIGFRVAESVTP